MHDGTLQFIKENGTTIRYCVFADTSRCKEEKYLEGSCSPGGSLDKESMEDARILAEGFIKNSPTYRYDGFGLKQASIIPLDCKTCWQVVYEFSSQSSGYGDRINQNTLPIRTLHQVQITVEDGAIKKAFIDGKWDMLEEKMIS